MALAWVRVPRLSESQPWATVLGWLLRERDSFHAGQGLVELETSKADVEVPAPARPGVLIRQLAQAGDVLPAGARLALCEVDW